jgi:hypothetical protein
MKGRWRLISVFLGVVSVGLAGSFILRAPDPGLVLELPALPEMTARMLSSYSWARRVPVDPSVDGTGASSIVGQARCGVADVLRTSAGYG